MAEYPFVYVRGTLQIDDQRQAVVHALRADPGLASDVVLRWERRRRPQACWCADLCANPEIIILTKPPVILSIPPEFSLCEAQCH